MLHMRVSLKPISTNMVQVLVLEQALVLLNFFFGQFGIFLNVAQDKN